MRKLWMSLVRRVGKWMVETGWGWADYGKPKVIQYSGWSEPTNTLGVGIRFWGDIRGDDTSSASVVDDGTAGTSQW